MPRIDRMRVSKVAIPVLTIFAVAAERHFDLCEVRHLESPGGRHGLVVPEWPLVGASKPRFAPN